MPKFHQAILERENNKNKSLEDTISIKSSERYKHVQTDDDEQVQLFAPSATMTTNSKENTCSRVQAVDF